jgi:hypothetical protein
MSNSTPVWTCLFIDNDNCENYVDVFATEEEALCFAAVQMTETISIYENIEDNTLDLIANKINAGEYRNALNLWTDWQYEDGTGLELIVSESVMHREVSRPISNSRAIN